MISQTTFSIGRLDNMAREAIECRHIPALLDARSDLIHALEDQRVPRKHKKMPGGRIRILLGMVQRELDELNDEEARRLVQRIEWARQDAGRVITGSFPLLKKIAPLGRAILTITGACREFSSRGYMIGALGRVKLGSTERGDEALDGLIRVRDELMEKLSELKDTDSFKKAVHSATCLLKAAKATGNMGAVRAHERTLRELGASVA